MGEPETETVVVRSGKYLALPVERQTYRYKRYVENWNRAVGVQKKAINKIEEIWKPFKQNEHRKLLDEWEHAVVMVEKAARMGVKEAKALAEEERKEIEQRR